MRMRPFCLMSGNLVFCDKAKLFLDNKVPGGLDTGEASRFVTSFFEVAGYNCGQMRAQKCFRFLILVPSLYLGTEIGSAGRTLNRPLQKARFTFQALLEFDWRVWMDQLTLYMTSGKVMLALLQLPALFHYGETLVTTTVEAPSIGRKISTALPDQFPGPSV